MNLSHLNQLIISLLLLLSLSACHEKDVASATMAANKTTETKMTQALTTDADKFNYALGMMISENILKQFSEIDYDILSSAIKTRHQGGATPINLAEASQILNDHQQQASAAKRAETIAKGKAYLQANAEIDGVEVTESGLQYTVIVDADGEKPTTTDSVTVHYRGTLLDGTEFDNSYSRSQPATFRLNQVIPGWTEGVQLMSEGARFKFVIPYQLAYGERGAGPSIGPYETLIFEVELIKINP